MLCKSQEDLWESGSRALCILNLRTTWMWVARFTFRPLYSCEKIPSSDTHGIGSSVRPRAGQNFPSLSQPGMERPSSGPSPTPTELPRFQQYYLTLWYSLFWRDFAATWFMLWCMMATLCYVLYMSLSAGSYHCAVMGCPIDILEDLSTSLTHKMQSVQSNI